MGRNMSGGGVRDSTSPRIFREICLLSSEEVVGIRETRFSSGNLVDTNYGTFRFILSLRCCGECKSFFFIF